MDKMILHILIFILNALLLIFNWIGKKLKFIDSGIDNLIERLNKTK